MAANYRAACRARSRAEFVARMGIVVEEVTKQSYGWNCWGQTSAGRWPAAGQRSSAGYVPEAGIVRQERMKLLLVEANELLAIFSSSRRTAKSN